MEVGQGLNRGCSAKEKKIKILIKTAVPCGGGLEYLHRSPARRKRRRKGNPPSGGITGPHCHWGTFIQRPGPPGWGLDARL
jgi:hypothetical protein